MSKSRLTLEAKSLLSIDTLRANPRSYAKEIIRGSGAGDAGRSPGLISYWWNTGHYPISRRQSDPGLYGAFFVKRSPQAAHLFSSSVSLFDLEPVSSPRPTYRTLSRAGAVKVGRRANLATRSIIARPHLDSSEHGGTLVWSG